MSCDFAKGTVVVTGATGAVGPAVVKSLTEQGFGVRTFSVDPPSEGLFPAGTNVELGDVRDSSLLRDVFRGACAAVHMAALLHVSNPPPELRQTYFDINVLGTRNVVQAACAAGCKRLVFFSTINVYRHSPGATLCEDAETIGGDDYARSKLEAEGIVLGSVNYDGQPIGTVLRLAAVYGGRVKGNYRRLVRALARGRFLPIGSGGNRRTVVYDRDVGAAATLAVCHPNAAGRVFNVSDGRVHKVREIVQAICVALGRPVPRSTIPVGLAMPCAKLGDAGLRMFQRPAMFQNALLKYLEDIAVDASRIRTELGFEPAYDLTEGWRGTIRELRLAGEI